MWREEHMSLVCTWEPFNQMQHCLAVFCCALIGHRHWLQIKSFSLPSSHNFYSFITFTLINRVTLCVCQIHICMQIAEDNCMAILQSHLFQSGMLSSDMFEHIGCATWLHMNKPSTAYQFFPLVLASCTSYSC